MWNADIITFVAQSYPNFLGSSVLGRGLKNHLWDLNILDIYDFSVQRENISQNEHLSSRRKGIVDDNPYGGGAGMVLRPDVAGRAIEYAINRIPQKRRIVYPSPVGKIFTQEMAKQWSQEDGIIFLCGRFEGVDARIFDAYPIEEVSLGDFVLCGGDVAVVAMLEATIRLVAGVLGDEESFKNESFSESLLEHPHYTRPAIWGEHKIPDILLSGNHAAITAWRLEEAKKRTKERRTDLWEQYCYLTGKDI